MENTNGNLQSNNEHSSDSDSVFKTAKEMLDNDITEISMLWGHFFQKYGLALVSGSSDVGKSSFMRQFAIAIVTGQDKYLDYELKPEHHRVIYISSEDDYDSLSVRFKKECPDHNNETGYENLLVLLDGGDPRIILEAELEKQPFDCIIIDALGDFLKGDVNAVNNTRQFLSDYLAICQKYKCLVIFLHHNRKTSSDTKPKKNDVLGSQGLEAKPRSVLQLSKNSSKKRELKIVKANYVPDEEKEKSIILSVDENFIFKNTGIIEDNHSNNQDDEINNTIRQLYSEGKSLREAQKDLAEKFGKKAPKKSTIGKRFKQFGKDYDNGVQRPES